MNAEKLMGKQASSWERLRQAIEKGDKAEALKLLEIVSENASGMRGVLTDAIDIALTALAGGAGEEAVHQAMRKFCARDVRPFIGPDTGDLTAIEKLGRRVQLWTEGHGVPVDVEEDREKYILRIPCDTGGRIVNRGKFGKTKRPYPWSGGQKGVGYYCTHCPISFELVCVEQGLPPWWITSPPRKAGDKCTQYIFKNDQIIPEEYYARLGHKKPGILAEAAKRKPRKSVSPESSSESRCKPSRFARPL